jgi:hypothetical protein
MTAAIGRKTTMAKTTRTATDGPAATPPPEIETEAEIKGDGAADAEFDMSGFTEEDSAVGAQLGDDFDSLESFALPQDFDPGVEEEDPPVSVRRPGPFDFFRVHPDPAMAANVGIVELKDERDDPYLVKPNMYAVFGNLVSRRRLVVYKTAQGGMHLWAIRLNDTGGRRSGGGKYNETAIKAAERAKAKWTRIASDQEQRCYRIYGPSEEFPDPDWSKTPQLLELMRKAFGDGYLIKDANHPLVRRIRGRTS